MARLSIFVLDSRVRQNILDGKYKVQELRRIKEKLTSEIDKRRKLFRRATALVMAIAVFMLRLTYKLLDTTNGVPGVFWFTCAAMAAVICLVLALSWFVNIGLIQRQFDSAVRKSYPAHVETLCFKDRG